MRRAFLMRFFVGVLALALGAWGGAAWWRRGDRRPLRAGVSFRLGGLSDGASSERPRATLVRLDRWGDAGLRVAAVAWKRPSVSQVALEVETRCRAVVARPKWLVEGSPWAAVFEVSTKCPPVSWRLVDPQSGRTWAQARAGREGILASGRVWDVRREWSRAMEWLYSAWVARLFAEPRRTWRFLGVVVEDPHRNFLHGVLGLSEDRGPQSPRGVRLLGDCADVPYQLRAYFAWKLGLPFRFRECDRGTPRRGPVCQRAWDNLDFPGRGRDEVRRFQDFVQRGIAWRVHSATVRTLPEDLDADVYPIRIARDTLLPGTIYVDPSGHVLVIVGVDQGEIVAVDGHPDLTVTVQRFPRSRAFRFYPNLQTGGFKAFRPLRLVGGRVLVAPNSELRHSFSLEQYALGGGRVFESLVMARLGLRPAT